MNTYGRDLISLVGVLFGIFSFLGYISQRRANKKNESLIQLAELNVDKSVTQKEINSLQQTKNQIQEDVTHKIPSLALAKVINEKIAFHKEQIHKNYTELKGLQSQLDKIQPQNGFVISEEIESKVGEYLNTDSQLRQFRNQLIHIIIILTSIIVIFPFIGSQVLLGMLIGILILIYLGSNSTNKSDRIENYKLTANIFVSFMILIATIGLIYLAVYWSDYDINAKLYLALTCGPIIIGAFIVRKPMQKSIEKICEEQINL